MTTILLLCDDDGLENDLARALVVPLPDCSITTVRTTQAALDRIAADTYDAVLIYRPTSNVDSVFLLLAATRANPGRTVLSVSGGPKTDRIEFQMIVRMRDAEHAFPRPFPAGHVAQVLTSLVHGGMAVPQAV